MNTSSHPAEFPRLFRLRQQFPRPKVDDVAAEVRRQLATLDLGRRIQPGQRVAITAGSRGIADIGEALTATVAALHDLNAKPFLVPAMGSHGGATAEGQRAVLTELGITEDRCGCAIESSMETDALFDSSFGIPIHVDRRAHAADHVLIVGRVKPHTLFTGPYQSGLCKMLLIGLGKHDGARLVHAALSVHPFNKVLLATVPPLIDTLNVLGGLAVLENAYDETARIEAVRPEAFLTREPELLEQATAWMPRLPFDEVDVLVVDEIGKDISGSGMDTNIVGRKFDDNKAVHGERPTVRRIVARGLTPASHGNGLGVGIADIITQQLFDSINQETTWTNGLTSNHLGAVSIPPTLATDRTALAAALRSLPLVQPSDARLLWIANTRDLIEVACSEPFLKVAQVRDDLTVLDSPVEVPFDGNGNARTPMGRKKE